MLFAALPITGAGTPFAAVEDIQWEYRIGERWVYEIQDTALGANGTFRDYIRSIEYLGMDTIPGPGWMDTSTIRRSRFSVTDVYKKCPSCPPDYFTTARTAEEDCGPGCGSLQDAFGVSGTMTLGSNHFQDNQDSGSGRKIRIAPGKASLHFPAEWDPRGVRCHGADGRGRSPGGSRR
jgi:hypothetical protein